MVIKRGWPPPDYFFNSTPHEGNEKESIMSEARILSVTIRDETSYIPHLSNNGGHYAFEERYSISPNGTYRVRYWTTSEFHQCENCGHFSSCHGCEPEYISEVELRKRLREATTEAVFTKDLVLLPEGQAWMRKIRRRCNDAMCKTATPEMLYKVAVILGVSTE